MAHYYVDLDVTVSVQMRIDAPNETMAREEAKNRISADTMFYVNRGLFVETKITDCYED